MINFSSSSCFTFHCNRIIRTEKSTHRTQERYPSSFEFRTKLRRTVKAPSAVQCFSQCAFLFFSVFSFFSAVVFGSFRFLVMIRRCCRSLLKFRCRRWAVKVTCNLHLYCQLHPRKCSVSAGYADRSRKIQF